MIEVRHDAATHRFLATVSDHHALLTYHPVRPGVLDYTSTFVPDAARRRGIASAIVRHALEYAKAEGYRVVPTCWFVRQFIERHPEYGDLVAEGDG